MSPDLESDPYHDFSPENCSGIAGSSKQTPSHPSTDCALIRWTCLLSVPERRSSRKKGVCFNDFARHEWSSRTCLKVLPRKRPMVSFKPRPVPNQRKAASVSERRHYS